MASFYERSGRLVLEFRYRGQRCREQTKLEDTLANRKRAKQILERIEAEITLDTFDYSKYFPKSKRAAHFTEHDRRKDRLKSEVPTFREFAEVWYKESEISWRRSYKAKMRMTLDKYLLPAFGEIPLDQFDKGEMLAFRANLAKTPRKNGKVGFSADHTNKIMMPLRQILEEGADRFGFVSAFRGIKSLKIPRTHIEPFTLEEVNLIINTVRPDFKNYYTVRFFTGMRTAEIDGLKWQFVDFERREILVRETWVMNEVQYTKNDGSQREIHMSQPVYDALKAQYEVTGDREFVFCKRNGNPLSHNNVTKRVWYPLLRYLELKKRRPYETRHTAATLWLAAGESPEWIARQMGHTTTEMLFTVYSRYVPNLTRRDGSAIERLLAQRLDTNGGLSKAINPDNEPTKSEGLDQ